jgi:hypothetical protein
MELHGRDLNPLTLLLHHYTHFMFRNIPEKARIVEMKILGFLVCFLPESSCSNKSWLKISLGIRTQQIFFFGWCVKIRLVDVS